VNAAASPAGEDPANAVAKPVTASSRVTHNSSGTGRFIPGAECLGWRSWTVSGILTRIRMGKLGRIGLEPAQRYERARPGELININVKKLGRIHNGAEDRFNGNPGSEPRPATFSTGPRRPGHDIFPSALPTPDSRPRKPPQENYDNTCSATTNAPKPLSGASTKKTPPW
jgi:hypothetical protein